MEKVQHIIYLTSAPEVNVDMGKVPIAAHHYLIYVNEVGQIVLDPLVSVPDSEMWLFENKKALRAILQGIQDAKAGRLVDAPENYSKYLLDEKAEACQEYLTDLMPQVSAAGVTGAEGVTVQSFTENGTVTERMDPNEMIRQVTLTKPEGTTWKNMEAALSTQYGFDSDLRQAPHVDDKVNSYTVVLDRRKTFSTLADHNRAYSESEVNAFLFAIAEKFERLQGRSLTKFTSENGDTNYYEVAVKPYRTEEDYPVRVVFSLDGGVFGVSYACCFQDVVRAFPSDSKNLNFGS